MLQTKNAKFYINNLHSYEDAMWITFTLEFAIKVKHISFNFISHFRFKKSKAEAKHIIQNIRILP